MIGCGRVLLVDDELAIVEELAELLETEGYTCFTCDNGKDAKRLLCDRACDAVVIDLRMPVTDGFQLLKWLCRQPGSKPRIIALSGHAADTDRDNATKLGADWFLVKPVDINRLLSALE